MIPRISNFVREKDLQDFLHEYLPTIFPITIIGDEIIMSEGSNLNGRIDILAVDKLGNPVIIECKSCRKYPVLSQALNYVNHYIYTEVVNNVFAKFNLHDRKSLSLWCFSPDFFDHDKGAA